MMAAALCAAGASSCAAPDDERKDDAAFNEDALTTSAEAAQLLYLGARTPAECATGDNASRVRCLIRARYAADPLARDVALDLWSSTRGVAGLLPAQQRDGGIRGMLTLVPELPTFAHRQHLVWVRDAMNSFDVLFARLRRIAPHYVSYRYTDIDFRFFRSVGRTTPSAFTEAQWEVSYNVSGSLVTSAAGVRETLFHEIFHENDFARNGWSNVLEPIVSSIVARCGTDVTCLAPFTPTTTRFGGGTYYAFQPNGRPMVIEYSAELATRYFEEQDGIMRGSPRPGLPFKCGPRENARAWALVRDEFFGGADAVPPCQ